MRHTPQPDSPKYTAGHTLLLRLYPMSRRSCKPAHDRKALVLCRPGTANGSGVPDPHGQDAHATKKGAACGVV